MPNAPDHGFNAAAAPSPARQVSSAERALQDFGIDYVLRSDGVLVVEGDIDLSEKCPGRLPDLSDVILKGSFFCSRNGLKSLAGAPKTIGGDFICDHNDLVDMSGGPETVGCDVFADKTGLRSLAGAPRCVGGDFFCSDNRLRDLLGAPETVGGAFYCNDNQLRSLEGAPKVVGGEFLCHNNDRLACLEHAPQSFTRIKSDHGIYPSWEGVPEILRFSDETRRRLAQERGREAAHRATVLQQEMTLPKPFRLKKT